MRIVLGLSCAAVLLSLLGSSLVAGESERVPGDSGDGQRRGRAMKTLGGRQFWGDVKFFRGWSIQQNVVTGHFRLLDPRDCRHAWGSREQCEAKLQEIRKRDGLSPMTGHAVILLHGIARSSKAMAKIGDRLEAEGYLIVPFDYPSTREGLGGCARFLDEVVCSLEGVEQISFVGHSMGGLVVRKWMADFRDERIARLLMLGTPNHGAQLADRFGGLWMYQLVLGPGGRDLVSSEDGEIARLPIPQSPFAVIAGAKGDGRGYNPWLDGDDDGVVSVSSVQLDGADDYLELPVLHSFLPHDERVIEAVVSYLDSGCFQGSRRPVAKSESSNDGLGAQSEFIRKSATGQ